MPPPINEGKRFLYFAFRQLRRIPEDWQPHYKYELINAVRQADFSNHPDRDVSSQREYYRLNAIKRGYHGVKWVLSRFDLDAPPIPEKFEDPNTPIYTNESTGGVYSRIRKEKVLSHDDAYMKVRTISEAEALMAAGMPVDMGDTAKRGETPFDIAMPHRMQDPAAMTIHDLEDDKLESEYGGTLYGDTRGYPEGMSAETSERSSGFSVWHSNDAYEIDREAMRKFGRSIPAGGGGQDRELHRKAVSSEEVKPNEPPPQQSRWTRGPDGKWKRQEISAPRVTHDEYDPPWVRGEY
eukprot:TRINITY_DN30231_c0_g1_i3.p1 TRINITY_DN30231_c0_g1~~TRINITY_DN30231_c0_g1_i3.p1  ORF type:complete len:295 (+),score=57.04 TRINITY_DN30231_c0_g1_i3:143-1027(+)